MPKCKLCGKEANFEFVMEKGKIWLCRKHYYIAEEEEEKIGGALKDFRELEEKIEQRGTMPLNMDVEQIKASFNVNSKLWEDFKIYCIKKKVTMTEKLEELIMKEMKKINH